MKIIKKKEIQLSEFICETYELSDKKSKDVVEMLYNLQSDCIFENIDFEKCVRAANCYFDFDNSRKTIVSVDVVDTVEYCKLLHEQMIEISNDEFATVKLPEKTGK